jgi:hypothetical protein
MGIAGSSDIFQGKMSELMESLEYVRAYLDDLFCISKLSLEEHLEKLEQVLRPLCNAGLKVNAAKLTFCALEIECLGYVLTRDSIKPQSNKLQAILAIKPPTGVKQLRHLLGMVQYYRDLWARWSDMLAPLTSLVGECGQTKTTKVKGTKKVPWNWNEVHQRAFNHVKATTAKDVVLAYPDYSKVFEIYTDASSKQLGAVITQDKRPIAFFSQKLSNTQRMAYPDYSKVFEIYTDASSKQLGAVITQDNRLIAFFSRKLSNRQRKYSVTKIELLAIVKTLKSSKGCYGAKT